MSDDHQEKIGAITAEQEQAYQKNLECEVECEEQDRINEKLQMFLSAVECQKLVENAPELAALLEEAVPLKRTLEGQADYDAAVSLYQAFTQAAADSDKKECARFICALAFEWRLYTELQFELYKDGQTEWIQDRPASVLARLLTQRGRRTMCEDSEVAQFRVPAPH